MSASSSRSWYGTFGSQGGGVITTSVTRVWREAGPAGQPVDVMG